MMHQAAARDKSTRANKTTASIVEQVEQLRQATQQMVGAGNVDGAIHTLLELITQQHHENARLESTIKAMVRARFARKSEKLTLEELGQLALALGASEQEAAQPEPSVPVPPPDEEIANTDNEPTPRKGKNGNEGRRHPGRTRLDPALPRRITVHPVPACDRDCLHCGTTMKHIGYLDHERVEYIPARIEVAVDRREKMACLACGQDIAVAPRPGHCATDTTVASDAGPQPTDTAAKAASQANTRHRAGCTDDVLPEAHVYRRAGASLLAQLLEAKADDALPIYRQRQQFSRLGFDVPLNTLYGYWDAAARIVQPVAQAVLSAVLGDPIVGLDDTRLDWLDPTQKGRSQRGHLWCFMGTTPLVAFEFTKTWRADEVAPWISAIDGYIQCDDYKGYGALIAQDDGSKAPLVPPEMRLGCWMHVRRRFHQALKAGEKHAIIPLGAIKELYSIEATAREQGLSPNERHALRQTYARPAAARFFAWVEQHKETTRPKSYLGKAIGYALEQKDFVMRCLSDGRFELDTGRVERQIKEPVIGRKNYLFSGSAKAAQRLAGVYSLVCSCSNLRISTRDYLIDIITKLQGGFPLRHINQLRPDIWAASRPTLVAYQMNQQSIQQTATAAT